MAEAEAVAAGAPTWTSTTMSPIGSDSKQALMPRKQTTEKEAGGAFCLSTSGENDSSSSSDSDTARQQATTTTSIFGKQLDSIWLDDYFYQLLLQSFLYKLLDNGSSPEDNFASTTTGLYNNNNTAASSMRSSSSTSSSSVQVVLDLIHELTGSNASSFFGTTTNNTGGGGGGRGNDGSSVNVALLLKYMKPLLLSLIKIITIIASNLQTPGIRLVGGGNLRLIGGSNISSSNSQNNPNQQSSYSSSRIPADAQSTCRNNTGVINKYVLFAVIVPTLYQYLKIFYEERQHAQSNRQPMQEYQQQTARRHDNHIPGNNINHADDDEGEQEDCDNPVQRRISMSNIATERQNSVLKTTFDVVDRTLPLIRLFLFLISFWSNNNNNNKSSKNHKKKLFTFLPLNLAMILSGLRYTSSAMSSNSASSTDTNSTSATNASTSSHRQYASANSLHVNYGHRRWLYEEFLKTIRLLFLPLSRTIVFNTELYNEMYSMVQSNIVQPIQCMIYPILRQRRRQPMVLSSSSSSSSSPSCPICGIGPITVPYITNCGHIHCYTCLWTKTIVTTRSSPRFGSGRSRNIKSKYRCSVCYQLVQSSRPYCDKENKHYFSSSSNKNTNEDAVI